MKNFTKIAAATLITIFASAAANADSTARTQVVKFDDLDLKTSAGAETLYNRIVAAAHSVCPGESPSARRTSCFDEAIARAVRQVNSISLNAYYGGKRPAMGSPTLTAANVR